MVDKLRKLLATINPQLPGNSFLLQRTVFGWIGLWPPTNRIYDPPNPVTNNPRSYRIYGIVVRALFLYLNLIFQAMYIVQATSIDKMARATFLTVMQLTALFKTENFVRNYDAIRAMLEQLNEVDFKPKNREETSMIKRVINNCFICNMAYTLVALTTLTGWIIYPVISGTPFELLLPAWYPFDMTKTGTFTFFYVYQLLVMLLNIACDTCIDTFTVGCIMHITVQTKRLGLQLEKLGLESAAERMKHHIIFHQKILEFVATFEGIFGVNIFVQICCSVVILCMIGFVVLNGDGVETASNANQFCVLMAQIFFYCYSGNELIFASSELLSKTFFPQFSELDRGSQKNLQIFLQRVKHDISIQAQGIVTLTLGPELFITIVQTAYSYFAVLQTLEEK